MEVTSRILSALEVTKVRVDSLSSVLVMLGDGGGESRGIVGLWDMFELIIGDVYIDLIGTEEDGGC